jgi:cytochrome c5
MQKKIYFLFLMILVIGVLAGCNSATPVSQPPTGQPTAPAQATANSAATSAPAADGASLVESRCTACHTLDRVKAAKKTKDQWAATVAKMISNGAKLTPAEQTIVIDYLSKTYP